MQKEIMKIIMACVLVASSTIACSKSPTAPTAPQGVVLHSAQDDRTRGDGSGGQGVPRDRTPEWQGIYNSCRARGGTEVACVEEANRSEYGGPGTVGQGSPDQGPGGDTDTPGSNMRLQDRTRGNGTGGTGVPREPAARAVYDQCMDEMYYSNPNIHLLNWQVNHELCLVRAGLEVPNS